MIEWSKAARELRAHAHPTIPRRHETLRHDAWVLVGLVLGTMLVDCGIGVTAGLVSLTTGFDLLKPWQFGASVATCLMITHACILIIGSGFARRRSNHVCDDRAQPAASLGPLRHE